MNARIGIDYITSYIPKTRLDLTDEWAEIRSKEYEMESKELMVSKLTKGIGVTQFSIPDYNEDSATMAANAALKLIQDSKISLEDIATITVATETTVDYSKSAASYVLGMLEKYFKQDLSHVGCPQVQFACIGGTYAIENCIGYIASGIYARKYHIVICSDVAKYDLQSPGEPTQGAGAIAFSICENPRLLEIDYKSIGTHSRDERDFFRPINKETPTVNGKDAIKAYCDCIEGAALNFIERQKEEFHFNNYDNFIYHVPFPRMAEYASITLFSALWERDEEYKEMVGTLKKEAGEDYQKVLKKDKFFQKTYSERVSSSLSLAKETGNIYTGSMYLALISLIKEVTADNLPKKNILFISYGSGASAKVFQGNFVPNAKEVANQIIHSLPKEEKIHITFKDYQDRHSFAQTALDESTALLDENKDGFVLSHIGAKTSSQLNDVGFRYYSHS